MSRTAFNALDKQTKLRIRKLFAEGVDASALAERFGVTCAYICNIIKEKSSQ